MHYTVHIVNGDYYPRQATAKKIGAKVYVEVHGNALDDPTVDGACCVIAAGSSPETQALATQLAAVAVEVAPHHKLREGGLRVGGKGWGNVDETRTGCPSALWEPGFLSCPEYDDWCRRKGLAILGERLAMTIRGAVPHGGIIALSIGHMGRTSHPDDKGAPRVGGGWEVDHNREIVTVAAGILGRMSAMGVR